MKETEAARYISSVIREKIEGGKRVLWIVPGGSAIAVAVLAAKQLTGCDLNNLSVTLTDERYGNVGHKDSNWQQLQDAGFVASGAHMYPVLNNKPMEETVGEYDATLKKLFEESDYKIGLFGIGTDGHTAGILPHTSAVVDTGFATAYKTETYERITMTPHAITLLDEGIVYASGESKKEVLKKLQETHSLDEMPSQALKQAKKFIIFND